MQPMKINDQVTVGSQPREDELQRLGQQGFKSVVNFRKQGEENQLLSPQAEGELVESAGLAYRHIPMSVETIGPELVEQFREKFADLPKPVFAHCGSGKRAGMMVMMHIAVEQGITGEQTLQKAKEMGFECEQPELQQFVRQYVDS